MGYRNKVGPAGTRNLLGIVTTVQCAAGVVKVAVERIKKELLPKYPNVDGVVASHPPLWLRRGHQCPAGLHSHPGHHQRHPPPQLRR